MAELWAFIKCTPQLYALVVALVAIEKKAVTDFKVKEALRINHEAWAAKDPAKMNKVFAEINK